MNIPLRRTAAPTGYLLVVTVLMALATADPNRPRLGLFVASLVLCLPTMLAALPVFYFFLAMAWNLTDAGNGGPKWPVSAAYVVAIGLVAVGNVFVVRRAHRRRRKNT